MSSEKFTLVKSPEKPTSKPAKVKDEGCSIWMMILLATPRLAIQLAFAAQWAGIGPILQSMIPSWAVQLTQLIGPTTGILVAPTVGALSDSCTSRWGRRRPFLFIGGMGTIVCWILMANTVRLGQLCGDKPDEPGFWKAFFMIIFYAWMDITINIVMTPAKLLIADFAGNRQVTGAAVGQAATTLGCLCVAAYIQAFGPASQHLEWFFAFLSAVMFLSIVPVCIFAKEKPLQKSELRTTSCENIRKAFNTIVIGIKTLPKSLHIYAMIFMLFKYGFTAYSGSKGQFFGLKVYNGVGEGADVCNKPGFPVCTEAQLNYLAGVKTAGGRTDIYFNVIGYFFAFAIPFLVKRLGSRRVLMLGLVPQCFLVVLATCYENVTVDIIIVVSTCTTVCILYTLIVPIILNGVKEENKRLRMEKKLEAANVQVLVHSPTLKGFQAEVEDDEEEEEDQNPNIGLYVGAINSANCLGQVLNFGLSSLLVTSSWGYSLPIFVGGCLSFVALLLIKFCLKLNFYSY